MITRSNLGGLNSKYDNSQQPISRMGVFDGRSSRIWSPPKRIEINKYCNGGATVTDEITHNADCHIICCEFPLSRMFCRRFFVHF